MIKNIRKCNKAIRKIDWAFGLAFGFALVFIKSDYAYNISAMIFIVFMRFWLVKNIRKNYLEKDIKKVVEEK